MNYDGSCCGKLIGWEGLEGTRAMGPGMPY